MIKAWKTNNRWWNLHLFSNWKSFRIGYCYKGKVWGVQPTLYIYFMFWELKICTQKRYKNM